MSYFGLQLDRSEDRQEEAEHLEHERRCELARDAFIIAVIIEALVIVYCLAGLVG